MIELESPQKEIYSKERYSALDAQRAAQEIAFGPVVFQVARLMLKFGIFQLLDDHKYGLTLEEIAERSKISKYGAQCLLESSLTVGTVLLDEGHFKLAKPGWFLLHDDVSRVNMNFVNDVNYLGMFNLEEAIVKGTPAGLKVFGEWPTIYEGLSQLPKQVQQSWFEFDHYYSDCSFDEALKIVFAKGPKRLLDVGGNTGRFASRCVTYNQEVEVTVMDLPQQLELMKGCIEKVKGKERIHGYGGNLLDDGVAMPKGFDVIWMSQFLDCFSEEEAISILRRVAEALDDNSRLYIMETFWDRQRFEPASYCLAQISIYFTAMANGNSKMYYSKDMERCVNEAGLEVEQMYDGLGKGHSLMVCKRRCI